MELKTEAVSVVLPRQSCRGVMFAHGSWQRGKRKLLWQFTVAIKSDPVAPVNAPRVRYSAAYPTRAERMLRRETKTTVAIYCGNQV